MILALIGSTWNSRNALRKIVRAERSIRGKANSERQNREEPLRAPGFAAPLYRVRSSDCPPFGWLAMGGTVPAGRDQSSTEDTTLRRASLTFLSVTGLQPIRLTT